MTNKELIKILRRFNRSAAVTLNGNNIEKVYATVNQDGQWTIHLIPEKLAKLPKTSQTNNEKSLDKED